MSEVTSSAIAFSAYTFTRTVFILLLYVRRILLVGQESLSWFKSNPSTIDAIDGWKFSMIIFLY